MTTLCSRDLAPLQSFLLRPQYKFFPFLAWLDTPISACESNAFPWLNANGIPPFTSRKINANRMSIDW
jgi:hypothetical protein